MLPRLLRVVPAKFGSSAFCMRSFAIHRIDPINPYEFYLSMDFQPSHTDSKYTNFVNFLKKIEKIPVNVSHAFLELGRDQVKDLCQGVSLSDLKEVSPLVASKIIKEFDGNSFQNIYRSPEDLIDLYNKVGMIAFDYKVPSYLYRQIITTSAALTEVFSAMKGEDKEHFLGLFGIKNIKGIILKKEKNKEDIRFNPPLE